MHEKRQYKRIDFRKAVRLQIPGKDRATGCVSRDISEGGIRIHVSDFVPVNEEIMMTFALDTGEVIGEIGRVVWVQRVPHGESYQLGLQFMDKSSNYLGKKRIRQYIESHQI